MVIESNGPSELPVQSIDAENVGWKAFGLASMPSEWVPPFFVVSGSCFSTGLSKTRIQELISGFASTVFATTEPVIVRSSGSSETAAARGQLQSKQCVPQQICETICELINGLPSETKKPLHWIVQQVIPPQQLGHLSNERHLREEHRDWIVEIETLRSRPGYAVPFGVRRWRDGIKANVDLACMSELLISRKLKGVAMWAMDFSSRLHFEWVWDGRRIWMVQAEAAEMPSGIDPATTIPKELSRIRLESLRQFRVATENDYQAYRKLRNAHLYSKLGYQMPCFYVLDDREEIDSILSGIVSDEVKADLSQLTKRGLMLRTEGENIAEEKRDMLPRSDVLSSAESACLWLIHDFKLKIDQSELNESHLCLLAHHFIPSIASAWAGAKPGNPLVRIESLWGVPEGLYWYSHDTFEVDTLAVELRDREKQVNYKIQERLRYKGTFIAPDLYGNLVPHTTATPFDWSSSIRVDEWMSEIAHTTRQIAERVRAPISLMWFLDNHKDATAHQILPWFHSQLEDSSPIKAAPRRKVKSAADFVIRFMADWRKLQDDLSIGRTVERVIVEPAEAELIRNPEFAHELGKLAAAKKFVVELSGGVLSHVFYSLRREGAQVECKDLYGDDEDIVEYDKLVRDGIPAIIRERGEAVETIRLQDQALITSLQEKLVEEAYEARDARSETDLIGELADLQEVIAALSKWAEISETAIKATQEQKRKKRGGFDRGTMLIKTATPHSIQKPIQTEAASLIPPPAGFEELVISDPADIPAKRAYRRPDLRQVDQQLEKMFTFEAELSTIGNRQFESPLKQTLNFSLPIDNQTLNMTLTIELVRSGSSLRGVVRLRSGALQLPLDFPVPEGQLKIQFPD